MTFNTCRLMLMYGTNLLSSADKLQTVGIEDVYKMVSHPSKELQTALSRLRAVREIDIKQYASLKRMLPYFVCGSFNPPFRRSENFAYTQCFVLDIDHLSVKGMNAGVLLDALRQDDEIAMAYVSPGQDGIKVLFKLKERCYDVGLFSLFYKMFANAFSVKYNLQQVLDKRTCDVTRACFLSCDVDAYYNADAVPVDMNVFLPTDDVQQLFDIRHEVEKEDAQLPPFVEEQAFLGPDDEALAKIKLTLSERKKQQIEKEMCVFVPQILHDIMPDVQRMIEESGIVIKEIRDIQYRKKLLVCLGVRQGEINLFYGKRGFSVVQSPKRGVSGELNQVTADLVECYLAGCR